MIQLHNQQKRYPIQLRKLNLLLQPLPSLLGTKAHKLPTHVDVIFVTPKVSARVHQDFFQDPTPTDVMSFAHGELIICPAIAHQQKKIEDLTLENELLTYIIHGVLHLCGWNDQTTKEFEAMKKEQTRLRNRLLTTQLTTKK